MGVAVVIVNHLRTVSTLLHEILPRSTTMPVELITQGLVLQPNHVFIIPAQCDLHVLDGEFQLKRISKPRGGDADAGTRSPRLDSRLAVQMRRNTA
jgi:two-component system, chemotaxis family, protein-glutamate methylesterase/glutaminase